MEIPYSLDYKGLRIDHTTVSPRFSVTSDESVSDGIAYLNQHGYAVFSDLMADDEINHHRELLWKFLETIPGAAIQRSDPSTWSHKWPGLTRSGVVNACGIGQSDFMWSVRANRHVKRVYSQVWNTNALLVSFDGCGLYRDWRHNPEWKTKSAWYHVDQNPRMKPNRCCVQGSVSLTDQNESTGGMIVFPGTHDRFSQMLDLARRPTDFITVPASHPILDRGQAIGRLVQCRAGDLVLWDSRLVHCNNPAFVTEELPRDAPVDLLRIVAYVSMSPASFVYGQTLDQFRKKRKELFCENCTLNHWSTELVEASSRAGLPKVSPSKLDAHQRALLIGSDFADDDA